MAMKQLEASNKAAVKAMDKSPVKASTTAQVKVPAKTHARLPSNLVLYTAMAACLLIVFIASIIRTPNHGADVSDIFVTKLTDGQHTEYVVLKEGSLSFDDGQGIASVRPPLSLGNWGIDKEQWSREQYMQYLGKEITIGYMTEGLALQWEAADVRLSDDGSVEADSYTMGFASQEGESLTICISKGRLPSTSRAEAIEDSHIRGSSLTVGIREGLSGYWAQFIHDGIGYYIESNLLSQAEFIQILYGILQ
jgi:hypothetical protein